MSQCYNNSNNVIDYFECFKLAVLKLGNPRSILRPSYSSSCPISEGYADNSANCSIGSAAGVLQKKKGCSTHTYTRTYTHAHTHSHTYTHPHLYTHPHTHTNREREERVWAMRHSL